MATKGCKGGKGATGGKGDTGQTFIGTVKVIGEKFGFIACEQVQKQHGNDVFAPATALTGLSEGDKVQFKLRVNAQGQPQATEVKAKKRANPTQETFIGTIKVI